MRLEKEASSSCHVIQVQPPAKEDMPLLSNAGILSSQYKTFAYVVIAVIGSGVLGLPYTFKWTGWVMGILILYSVAFLSYYCMMMLVYTRRKLESACSSSKIASFGDLGFAVCGSVGRFAVDIMIILSQAGFCTSYLVFIANTLAHVFNHSSADVESRILGLSPKAFYIWGCFPFQLGINSIPLLTHLAPLSIFADIVDLGAVGAVMVEDVLICLRHRAVARSFGSFSVFFYGLGVAVYSFEGMGMVLPLESEMKDRNKFGKILGLSMALISLTYGAFGVLGYLAFGAETKDIITTNFGRGIVNTLVHLGLCTNLFFTFPLMMNPVYEVSERRFCEARYNP